MTPTTKLSIRSRASEKKTSPGHDTPQYARNTSEDATALRSCHTPDIDDHVCLSHTNVLVTPTTSQAHPLPTNPTRKNPSILIKSANDEPNQTKTPTSLLKTRYKQRGSNLKPSVRGNEHNIIVSSAKSRSKTSGPRSQRLRRRGERQVCVEDANGF